MATAGSITIRPAANAAATVLVVDDERPIRDLLSVHLRNAGYKVVQAEDAIAAGRHLLERPGEIDLIVVDAQLPYLSGIEFASTVLADTTLPALPMILITGHEHLAVRAERLDLPCLVKPFSAERLIALVRRSLLEAAPRHAAGVRHENAVSHG